MRFETYDRLQEWITEHIVIKKKERFLQVSSRKYLLETFKRGETRTSVLFTARSENNNQMLCRAIFYLYEEKTTGKICVFYVVYDLTEQQQKERERDNLEKIWRKNFNTAGSETQRAKCNLIFYTMHWDRYKR